MDNKITAYIAAGIIILLLVLGSFGMIGFKGDKVKVSAGNADYSNLPEECKPPAGQEIEAWKEHLGHHSNTLYCLDYFR